MATYTLNGDLCSFVYMFYFVNGFYKVKPKISVFQEHLHKSSMPVRFWLCLYIIKLYSRNYIIIKSFHYFWKFVDIQIFRYSGHDILKIFLQFCLLTIVLLNFNENQCDKKIYFSNEIGWKVYHTYLQKYFSFYQCKNRVSYYYKINFNKGVY